MNISDDILAFAETKAQHDESLRCLLMRLHELNLTLNPIKCEFGKPRVDYYGLVFLDQGMSADPKKVSAVKACKLPNPTYAMMTASLRQLVRGRDSKVPFV